MPKFYDFKSFIIPSLVIAALYMVLTAYLMNSGLVWDAIFGAHSLNYKVRILTSLVVGLVTSMTGVAFSMLLITALLTGANITLLIKTINVLKSAGKLHVVVGGSSILGIVGSGCASCGLPILSLLGITGSLSFLPYGVYFSYISVILLGISLYFLVKSYNSKIACEIK